MRGFIEDFQQFVPNSYRSNQGNQDSSGYQKDVIGDKDQAYKTDTQNEEQKINKVLHTKCEK